MKTIYKYALRITDYQTIDMPGGADILDFQMQNGTLCVWAMVYPDNELERRKFRIIGTGDSFNDDPTTMWPRATVQDGAFVWHVFELFE